MVLVVGATGTLGSEICGMLAKAGESVRALVRKTSASEKIEALRAAGVALSFGDLKEPRSLAEACKGVDVIISTASSTFSRQEGDSIETVDSAGQLNLVAAAEATGVPRFIFVSFRHPEGMSFPLNQAKLKVEEAIRRLNFTVVQASYFMESWLTPALGFDYANSSATIYGSGNGPTSWVAVRDVANMCVLAVRHPAAERRIITFGGPEALSPNQVIAKFEKLTGKVFAVRYMSEEEILAQYQAAGDPMEKSFAALMLGYTHGDAIDMKALQAEFGLSLTTVDDYAREVTSRS